MKHLLSVVGARPNFIKVGALHAAFSQQSGLCSRILHTGQHYDARMSDVFFRQLGLPEPDVYLGLGGGSHAVQTARIMVAFEEEVQRERPDLVVVVGDVNSTLACALVCAKLHIPVAHVEAGLRSGDRSMPEEINRLVTDAVADYLFVTEQSGVDNLRREGVAEDKIFFSGNVMIDTLLRLREKAERRDEAARLSLLHKGYVLMTMHRPATVDVPARLADLVVLVRRLAEAAPVVFPVHPRTRANLERAGLLASLLEAPGVRLTGPIGYLEFLSLMMQAGVVVTDSGGVQEETTALQVPCITLRPNTERPVTVALGTNELMPLDVAPVRAAVDRALAGQWKRGTVPPRWDGRAAERIAAVLASLG